MHIFKSTAVFAFFQQINGADEIHELSLSFLSRTLVSDNLCRKREGFPVEQFLRKAFFCKKVIGRGNSFTILRCCLNLPANEE